MCLQLAISVFEHLHASTCSNSFLAFLPQGRSDNPAQQEIELTTAPSLDSSTHWGQQVCITEHRKFFCISSCEPVIEQTFINIFKLNFCSFFSFSVFFFLNYLVIYLFIIDGLPPIICGQLHVTFAILPIFCRFKFSVTQVNK